jgi:CO/xanthine dehydrogenase FAD-binding subunit
MPARDGWKAHPLFAQCANALLASFKIWNVATVGGNIALGLPAGAMIALASALDATAELWGPDGADRSLPAAKFITGVRETALMPGELLRAIRFPVAALRARTGFRRIALSPLGRTGTLVIARVDEDGSAAFTITGGTVRPRVLRFSALPTASELATAVGGIDDWYDDPHGSPDWRHALSTRFADELRVELGSAT